MRRISKLKIVPLFITLLLFQRLFFSGEVIFCQIVQPSNTIKKTFQDPRARDTIKFNQRSRISKEIRDTTHLNYKTRIDKGISDTVKVDSVKRKDTINATLSDSNIRKKVIAKNINNFLNGVDTSNRIVSWKLDSKYYDLEAVEGIDTSLHFPHLFIPSQKRLETITSLGNIGAPLQSDHFFSRDRNNDFLFARFYSDYISGVAEHKQYHVRKPLTLINYTMGGKSSKAEQTVRLLHTQNVNKFFNVGLTYDYFGTKGMYKNQETKDNLFSLFSSYYKNRFSFQGTISYYRIRNNENGGLTADSIILDDTQDSRMMPIKLNGASCEIKQKSFSGIVGYTLLKRWVKSTDSTGNQTSKEIPIFSLKGMFDANKQSWSYIDADTVNYLNHYISNGFTHDSAMLLTNESTILGEINQLAKFPGLPGLRFWITNTSGKYYFFEPVDYIVKYSDRKLSTNHFGVGVFSYSPYLSYSGSLRMYLNGYRSADKELLAKMVISPWKSEDYPYIKAKMEISDKEPDVFMKSYFSNHFKWGNGFVKEKWFMLGGLIGADKWRFEAGYNIVRINNYLYFDTTGVPNQASGLTVTSAYIQKELKFGGLYITNKVVWQAYDNKDALNLPTFSVFSAIFFEYELVKKVLTGRIGANVFYRTKFYADAFSPATGQFYNQKVKQIGDYPVVDAFVDFKWKRAVLFFKADHLNNGAPNSEYFSALHYPLNRMIFKIGVSWIFYD